ncbi:Zinc finger MYM-type protein 1 [Anabarilius grahami]|uniref:Zinc finger MYM-type protein 1 n=1 Tax=Anabarilius grahami TaxID=495550 RepID=A0A3N0Z2L4_ANAGA|nr:Zinc finger MYM-type protein 1 [Anabarilius grahami]
MKGDRKRAFNKMWYTQHQWLEYSVSRDSAYCFPCRHFSLPGIQETSFTSSLGYSNWKKAMYKDGGFRGHEKSENHVNAMIAWNEHKKRILTDTSMLNALDKKHQEVVEQNRTYIKTVAEVLLFTATQNISQRGHLETDASTKKGNFLGIMDLIAKHSPLIDKKLKAVGNAKYTSNTIQNEILECLSDMVRESIISEVKENKYFSIIVDETRDLKKKEQLSLVLRYYYNGAVHESFLDFKQATELDAEGLTQKIIQCLETYGLEYRSNLVGQGYDGASVMSGRHSGVAARIKAKTNHAFYVHCNAHCLNLVLVDSTKSVPESETFFSLLQKLYVYMSGSYVHQKWLSVQKEMYQGAPRELQRLSDTRWACRYQACKNIKDRLPAVLRVLHDIDVENRGERSVEARGLLAQLDLTFIGTLVIFSKVLGEAKFLADMLQSTSLDLAKAVDLVEAFQDTLQDLRSDSSFDEIWKDTVDTGKQCNVAVETVVKRPQKISSRLSGSIVESTVGQRRCKEGDMELFRSGIFFPILDCLSGEMQRRFSKSNCSIMQGIQALNPKSRNFLDEETIFSFARIYECDTDDIKHELHQVRRVLERKFQTGIELSSLLEFTIFLEPFKEVFYQLFRLCCIAVALPVSSASCERSFSALKLIKTHLRTTMTDDRLSNLGVLSIEVRRAKCLDLDDFVRRFASHHRNRRIQLF